MNGKWYWIELLGFDNEQSDFGVEYFFSRLSEPPEGIALLFSNVDFIHSFDGREEEYPLNFCDCSYSGHLYGKEGEHGRQNWTNYQLRGLVKALHARGTKVLFGCFDFCATGREDGSLFESPLTVSHPEIKAVMSTGERAYLVDPLSRFEDGGYYGDFLAEQIDRIIDYYAFDGVQMADGLSTARLSLQNGGCSDEMFVRFLAASSLTAPEGVSERAEGDAEAFARRRDWIFSRACEWTTFISDCWAEYYKRLTERVYRKGRIILFNSAWTRNPFEALYRYGFDYGKVWSDKIYAAMVEEVSATFPILSGEDNGGFFLPLSARRYYHYEFMLMQMKIKAYVPRMRQFSLSPVSDTVEQWDILKHSPMEMTRAILRRRNNFVFDGKNYVPTSAAPFYCLSDGIPASDWAYIHKTETFLPEKVTGVNGFALVFPSGEALYKELGEYISARRYTADALSNELVKNGFPVATAVPAAHMDGAGAPLLALNPHAWKKSERARLYASARPVLILSVRRLPEARRRAAFAEEGKYLSVYLIGKDIPAEGAERLRADLRANGKMTKVDVAPYDAHGAIWTSPLPYCSLPAEWFRVLSECISDVFGMPRNVNGEVECKVTAVKTGENTERLLVSNDEYYYSLPEIRLTKPVLEIKALTKYGGYRCPRTEKGFIIRVPPRGMEIVEITYTEG